MIMDYVVIIHNYVDSSIIAFLSQSCITSRSWSSQTCHFKCSITTGMYTDRNLSMHMRELRPTLLLPDFCTWTSYWSTNQAYWNVPGHFHQARCTRLFCSCLQWGRWRWRWLWHWASCLPNQNCSYLIWHQYTWKPVEAATSHTASSDTRIHGYTGWAKKGSTKVGFYGYRWQLSV